MNSTSPHSKEVALADELDAWPATGRGDGLDAAVVSRLMKQAAAALRGIQPPAGEGVGPFAWRACDERYPVIVGLITERQVTVDAWRESDIKFQALYALPPVSSGDGRPPSMVDREAVARSVMRRIWGVDDFCTMSQESRDCCFAIADDAILPLVNPQDKGVCCRGLTPESECACSKSELQMTIDCLQSIVDASSEEPREPDDADWRFRFLEAQRAAKCTLAALSASATAGREEFQSRILPWLLACFGPVIPFDKTERNHRFLEEALELVQSIGCTRSEAHQLADYVFDRPEGEPNQEVGGVMVTLAALCIANTMDMAAAGETELARIWTKVEAIRAKQAAKPKHSPLPALSGSHP